MNLRERVEQWEAERLSPFATRSAETKGRKAPAEKCDIRTEFQRDRDKITHSKSFRRLMHKTQVFLAPEGDHYRTRLTHTLEVTQIARTIARALQLNEDLTEAIALGHDLGHTPFGHPGEDALNSILQGGFRHNEQSVRVVEKLERGGEGLNLTAEVIDGILNHRSECQPSTLEGKVVRLSDKIGYINHDIDDAIRSGLLEEGDLPREAVALLGDTSSKRIDFLIRNVIKCSSGVNEIRMDEDVNAALYALRKYMFGSVYQSQLQMRERKKIKQMFEGIYESYYNDTAKLPADYIKMMEDGETKERVVCDYIACMTDRFALKRFESIFIPSAWNL